MNRQVPGVTIPFPDGLLEQPVLRARMPRFDAVLFRHEALQGATRDRRVYRAAAAGVLARGRAHAPADRRERIGSPGDEECLLVPSFGDELDVSPGVRRDGAAGLALDLRFPVVEVGKTDPNGHASSTLFRGLSAAL